MVSVDSFGTGIWKVLGGGVCMAGLYTLYLALQKAFTAKDTCDGCNETVGRKGFNITLRSPFWLRSLRSPNSVKLQPSVTLCIANQWTYFSLEFKFFESIPKSQGALSSRTLQPSTIEKLQAACLFTENENEVLDFSFLDDILSDDDLQAPPILSAGTQPLPTSEFPSNSTTKDLNIKSSTTGLNLAVIIGNLPLPAFTGQILAKCGGPVLCTDGGANRLMEYYAQCKLSDRESSAEQSSQYSCVIPNAVVGDLDSLRNEVRVELESKGTKIIHNPSQDTNDLEKTWDYFFDTYCNASTGGTNTTQSSPPAFVILLGLLGQRFDQTICNIHILYKRSGREMPVMCLVDEWSFCLVVPRGKSTILLPHKFVTDGCGLLPFVNCRSVTTSGLKWDLGNCQLGMYDIISSSNKVVSPGKVVSIETSDEVLWYSEVNLKALTAAPGTNA